MIKKRCNVYLTKEPTNITFRNGKMALHTDIRAIDLTFDQIRELLEDGQQVSQILNDYTEEYLTLDNYMDDCIFEAVLEKRENIDRLKNQYSDYVKEKHQSLRNRRGQLSETEYKEQERLMYIDIEQRHNEVKDQIQYIEEHVRGVPYESDEE